MCRKKNYYIYYEPAVISDSNVPRGRFNCIEIQLHRFMTDRLENVTGTTCLWYAPFFFLPAVIMAPPLYPCSCRICVSIYLNANLSAKSLLTRWGKNLFNHYMSTYNTLYFYNNIIYIYTTKIPQSTICSSLKKFYRVFYFVLPSTLKRVGTCIHNINLLITSSETCTPKKFTSELPI